MCFTEGQSNYHVHCLVIFFHKLEILLADLQNFVRAQKADKCKGVDGVQCQLCCGPPPLMDALRFEIIAAVSGFGNTVC